MFCVSSFAKLYFFLFFLFFFWVCKWVVLIGCIYGGLHVWGCWWWVSVKRMQLCTLWPWRKLLHLITMVSFRSFVVVPSVMEHLANLTPSTNPGDTLYSFLVFFSFHELSMFGSIYAYLLWLLLLLNCGPFFLVSEWPFFLLFLLFCFNL